MTKQDDRADFIAVFESVDGIHGTAVPFFDDGSTVEPGEPSDVLKSQIYALVQELMRQGPYVAYGDSKNKSFAAYIVIKKGYDEAKAKKIAHDFMKSVAMGVYLEFTKGTIQ